MPNPLRVCTTSGCPALVPGGGPCPTHKPAAWASSDRRSQLPRNWNTIRGRVLKRDGNRCVRCGAPATDVDHRDDPNDHSFENLQSLCANCHKAKTRTESVAGRRAKRGSTTA